MASNVCPICQYEIEYFAIGICNHPICLRCAVKLRRFGSPGDAERSCPTCRTKNPSNRISTTLKSWDEFDPMKLIKEPELNLEFENDIIEEAYKKLMSCVCPVCSEIRPTLGSLNAHTTNEHGLSYCDLCLRHAHMLPSEFKLMTRAELAAHRKWDSINRRGHPMCKFCREMFYEFEDLTAHIREKHFLCDICYSSRVFEVFQHQRELFLHYKSAHFVCPECEHNGVMSCFPTEERLAAHRSFNHTEEARNDPSIWQPVQIRYTNRGLISQYTRSGGRRGQLNDPIDEVPEVYYPAVQSGPNPEEWTGADFPTLTGAAASNGTFQTTTDNTTTETDQRQPQRMVRSHVAVARGGTRGAPSLFNDPEEFPSLQGAPVSSNATNVEAPSKPKWVVSKTSSTATASNGAAHKNPHQTVPRSSDFPTLPGASTTIATSVAKWGAPQPKAPPTVAAKSKAAPPPTKRQPTTADFPALETLSTSTILQAPRLEPFVPSQPVPSSEKGRKVKPKSPKSLNQLAPDLAPFSPALSKARKERWWNFADNEGAVRHYLLNSGSDDPHLPSPSYNRIQVDDHPIEDKEDDDDDTTQSKGASRPPDFSDLDFPSLTENSNRSGNKKAKQISAQNGKQSRGEKSNAKRPATEGKPNAKAKQETSANTKSMENFPDLEDTETYLFRSVPYTMPLDFEAKNRAVIEAAKEILGGSGHSKNAFTQCTRLCQRYSTGALSAQFYVQGLSSIFSPTSDPEESDWFSRMIALLPNVGLQRALFRALKGEAAPKVPFANTPARCRGNTPPVWAKSVTSRLQICPKCEQVCLRSDMREHASLAHS
ncbi:hypothetical protein Aperf_G00000118903 [Anoplocephala perfoliata]